MPTLARCPNEDQIVPPKCRAGPRRRDVLVAIETVDDEESCCFILRLKGQGGQNLFRAFLGSCLYLFWFWWPIDEADGDGGGMGCGCGNGGTGIDSTEDGGESSSDSIMVPTLSLSISFSVTAV